MHRARVSIAIGVWTLTGVSRVESQDKSWMARPEIREVREVYEEVQRAIGGSVYERRVREFEYCQPSFTFRAVHTDSAGTVRLYEKRGGSDDSARTVKYYYDGTGRLRFIFATTGPAWEMRPRGWRSAST